MPEMKDSGIEWIGEIPQTWIKCKIKNVCSTIGSGTTPTSTITEYYDNGTVNWIQSGDIYGKNEIHNVSTMISTKALTSSNSLKIYKSPFIIMAMYGGSVGNTAISYIDACTNQACCCIKPSKNVDLKFLYYWILLCKEDFLVRAEGGGQPNISQDKIKNQYFILPSLKEQNKISSFLDSKCSEIDALSADIQKEIETLEEYKKSVITEAVTKGLDPNVEMKSTDIEWASEVPVHWIVKPNKYVMKKVKDICPKYNGEDILSLTMNGVIVRDLDAGGKMPASFDEYQVVHPNNLLMCLFDYDVTPRCIGLIKNEGLTSPAYSQFVMKDGNSSEYYYYYYLMIDFTKELLHLAKNLRHSFTEEQLGAINAPVPPIDEQIKIARFLNDKSKEIEIMISTKQEQLATLEEYKKSIIYEYVTGKKEVPE